MSGIDHGPDDHPRFEFPPELRLDSGNPMVAGCERNSMPEATGCGDCGTCGCALIVTRSPGSLSKRRVVANFRPHCLPRNAYLCLWGSGVHPARGCRMRPKSLPESSLGSDSRWWPSKLKSEVPWSVGSWGPWGCQGGITHVRVLCRAPLKGRGSGGGGGVQPPPPPPVVLSVYRHRRRRKKFLV